MQNYSDSKNRHKILVTGSKGQLGSEIFKLSSKYHNLDFTFTDVDELDITNLSAIEELFSKNRFDFVINCAAYTAVDKAEEDVERAFQINHSAVDHLAKTVKKVGAVLVHVSTDYVFEGNAKEPYKSDDQVGPITQYGKSKLAGEQAIINSGAKYLIIRTAWLYSEYGSNFVKTMQRLVKERDSVNVVADQIGSPTWAFDLAEAILKAINVIILNRSFDKWGIYHFTNDGICSWYDFAVEIAKLSKLDFTKLHPISTKEYPTPAKRPYYSVLEKSKFVDTFGIELKSWKSSLQECIKRM